MIDDIYIYMCVWVCDSMVRFQLDDFIVDAGSLKEIEGKAQELRTPWVMPDEKR